MAHHNPAVEALVNDAKATSCHDFAVSQGMKLKRSGHNEMGPCPKCGGKDRFGINTADDKWFCRNCGVGGHDAISMVQLLWSDFEGKSPSESFLEACEVVSGRTRTDAVSEAELAEQRRRLEEKKARQEEESARRREAARKSAYNVWRRSVAVGDIISGYLEDRGMPGADIDALLVGKALRQCAELEYWQDRQVVHKGPAMVGCIQWLDDRGTFGGVHRTWTDRNQPKGKAVVIHNGERLESKKVMGSKSNGAIRLITPEGARRMILGEGIETTLTPWHHAFEADTAYWCGIDLNQIAGRAGRDPDTGKRDPDIPDMDDVKCIAIPSWVEELVILADDSPDPKKVKKVKQCLTRAAKRYKTINPRLSVKAVWPGNGGDFNDLVMDTERND